MILKKIYFLYYFLVIQIVTGLALFAIMGESDPFWTIQASVFVLAGMFLIVVGFGGLADSNSAPLGITTIAFFGAWIYLLIYAFVKTCKKQDVSRKIIIALLILGLVFMVGCPVAMRSFASQF